MQRLKTWCWRSWNPWYIIGYRKVHGKLLRHLCGALGEHQGKDPVTKWWLSEDFPGEGVERDLTKCWINNSVPCLYSSPVDARTNYHEFHGLKRCRLILLQFCRSEVPLQSHWAKTRRQQGYASLESSREKMSSAFSSFQRTHTHSLACGLFLHLSFVLHPVFLPMPYFWASCFPI